jgi:hypothetical protein
MAMRVGVGIAQLGRDTVLQALGNEVLQPFGFFMNFVPWIIQDIMEKSFQEPVMAKDLECTMLARCRQKRATMLFVLN